MPHVVLRGPVTAEDIWLTFEPVEFHEEGIHCKAEDCYLSNDKKTLLVRSVVVERNFPKSFFMKITEKDGALTVGLEALAGPERTDGVKRFLGLSAWKILQSEPTMEIEKGNIVELVRGPSAPPAE